MSTITWAGRAACATAPPGLFYAPDGEREPGRRHRENRARQICATCPVISECLTWALETGEREGTWGGKTEAERWVIRVSLGTAPPPPAHNPAIHDLQAAHLRWTGRIPVCKVCENHASRFRYHRNRQRKEEEAAMSEGKETAA